MVLSFLDKSRFIILTIDTVIDFQSPYLSRRYTHNESLEILLVSASLLHYFVPNQNNTGAQSCSIEYG